MNISTRVGTMQSIAALANTIQRLRLDVTQDASLRGNSPSPHEDFLKLAGLREKDELGMNPAELLHTSVLTSPTYRLPS
jgi:hypothetical protein